MVLAILTIINYAETHGLVLPGRIPGYKRSDLQLLPSSTTIRQVWLLYRAAIEEGTRAAAYSTFCAYWHKYLPQVIVSKPMTDLCAVCHKNSTMLVRQSNRSEEEKSQVIIQDKASFINNVRIQVLKDAEEHLSRATAERSYYTSKRTSTRSVCKEFYTSNDVYSPPGPDCHAGPLSGPSVAMYSFDYAQQVCISIMLVATLTMCTCRYITPVTHGSLGRFISRSPENAPFLVYTTKASHNKSTI